MNNSKSHKILVLADGESIFVNLDKVVRARRHIGKYGDQWEILMEDGHTETFFGSKTCQVIEESFLNISRLAIDGMDDESSKK